jgi:hypothetical protein
MKLPGSALHRTLPLLALLLIFLVSCRMSAQPEPRHIGPAEISKSIAKLPEYIGFGYSGVVFFQKSIYASCNLGLLVIPEKGPVDLLQWNSYDGVIEGPWLDHADGVLWAQQANDGSLLRFDGKKWADIPLPKPPDDSYTRGNALSGFRGISSADAFWIQNCDQLSRWNPGKALWEHETALKLSGQDPLNPFLPVKKGFHPEDEAQAYAITDQGVYARSKGGALFQLSTGEPLRVPCPGICKAITRSSDGKLMAYFSGKGVYLKTPDSWILKAQPLPGADETSYWVYLAEDAGKIVVVTAPLPEYEADTETFKISGIGAIWIASDGVFKRFPLEP